MPIFGREKILAAAAPSFKVEKLAWADEELGSIPLPAGTMQVRASFGSGMTRRRSDPPGVLWAVGDRGPNLKVKTLLKLYGLERIRPLEGVAGAKVMPRLDLGPEIAKLRVDGNRIELLSKLRLLAAGGAPVSGVPVPGGEHARCEPAFDLDGNPLEPDPSGLDTEGIAALADGSFWVGDEFGPSLVRVDAEGRILARFVPEGVALEGAAYPVHASLPAIAARRQLNRGFEAIALSPDEKWLFLAFQSPLAHPDEATHERARHVRLWRLDSATLELAGQYLYPLDAPETFLRDCRKGSLERSDLKVSEIASLGDDRLLVLERASETTKFYRVSLSDDVLVPPEHLDPATRPTLEELSGADDSRLEALRKELLFSTDEAQEVAADLEGMVVLSATELLLVNDNDFGVEGAETSFWRVTFDRPVLA